MSHHLRPIGLLALLVPVALAGDAEPEPGTTAGPSLHGQPGTSPTIAKPPWSSRVAHDDVGVYAVLQLAGQEVQLRYIPAGSLQAGTAEHAAGPARKVEVSAFWLGATEVTQGIWQAVMGGDPGREGGPDLPVTGVSWDDCHRFLERAGHMAGAAADLPSEAQWEYACRAGTTDLPGAGLGSVAWYRDNAAGHAHPVRQRIANPWGLYDMLGNAREWCADWYADPVPPAAGPDPRGPEHGERRVIRGGGWEDPAERLDAGRRDAAPPATRSPSLGFRFVVHGT